MLDFPSSRGRSTMKLKSPLVLFVCAFLGLTAALLHSGCETAEDFTIDVTPHNSEVTAPDQTVTLTASGWSGYVWSLVPENWEWGYLSGQTGKTVTYVVTGMPSTNSRPCGANACRRRSNALRPALGCRPSSAPTRTAKARS